MRSLAILAIFGLIAPATAIPIPLASPMLEIGPSEPLALLEDINWGTSHLPIGIWTNDDFDLEHGVVGGSGTVEDPYIIEGWDILPGLVLSNPLALDEDLKAGIWITNTTAHAKIRKNFIHDGGGVGVRIKNAANIEVDDNIITGLGAYFGIVLEAGRHLTTTNNTVTDTAGIWQEGEDLNLVANNVTACNEEVAGIKAKGNSLKIVDNTIADCYWGIGLGRPATNVTIKDNLVYGATWGIMTFLCGSGLPEAMTPAWISNNEFHAENAGRILCLSEFRIEDNTFEVSNVGLLVQANEAALGRGAFRNNHVTGAQMSPFNIDGHPYPYEITWENNTANGLPVIVVAGARDATLDGGGSRVASLVVVDAQNVTVQNWRSDTYQHYTVQQPIQVVRGHNVTVRGNAFENSGLRSLYGEDHQIIGNSIINGSLRVEHPSTVRVADNTIETWRQAFILRHARADSLTTLEGNYLSSNDSCTVCLTYAGGLTAVGNTIINAMVAAPISLHLDEGGTFRDNTIIGMDGAGGIVRTYPQGGAADARWNWWGTSAGPAVFSGDVLVDPWLHASPT